MIWKTLPLLCALMAVARLRAEEEPRSKSKICANVFCGAGRECAMTEKGEPTCLCIEKCKPHKRPVCGSNGKTYLNHCELHRDACLTGSKIQVDYDGHCKEKKSENPAASPVVCYQSDRDELRRRVIQWLEAEIIPDGWFSKGSNYSEVLDKYFKSFDDGDSRLDSTEFLKFVEQNETAVNITTYMDQETNKLLRGLCVDALIELSDENADWKLSFNEFLKCLSPSFTPPEKSKNSLLLGYPWDDVNKTALFVLINFVACQLFALLAAFWFRIYLGPNHASSAVRHAFATLFGIYFAVFCFGWYSIHLFVLVMMNYGIMNMASIPNIHRYSFVVAMGYLTLCHISRIYIFHYGILTTDFSGPLMIITQKITTLACQLHDGIGRQAEELTAEQNRLAVKTKPSLLEYLSYLLNFMSIIAGPCSNYKDYVAFIEGRHVHMKLLEVNWKQKGYDRLPDPSPTGAVMYKLCITLVSLILFLTLTKNFPMAYIIDNEFLDKTPFLSRLGYLYVVTQAAKPKYYFAWTLADAVNNAAGYGFSGVDERGTFHWDLLSNLNIWNIETATSFKMYIENWNIQTAAWLKRVCYDRAPWYPTALTFVLSALWHGVYPGYYFTFLTGILITLAARAIRNNCRHYFLSSVPLKTAYDVLTWAVTQLAVCYTVAPFVMLAVEPTIKFYKSMYFHMHILSILVLLVLRMRPQAHSIRKPQNQAMQNSVKSKEK